MHLLSIITTEIDTLVAELTSLRERVESLRGRVLRCSEADALSTFWDGVRERGNYTIHTMLGDDVTETEYVKARFAEPLDHMLHALCEHPDLVSDQTF
ncbi:hypothetical protein [Ancylobacter terrae]|uniref:hypothetical protein n=1 Tax=Ancylobacter sp. sgz301288 TaxID=3342077 RepID=UPI0038585668